MDHIGGHTSPAAEEAVVPPWHKINHVHAVNAHGEEMIFTYDRPSKIKGALKGTGHALLVLSLANSIGTVMAAPAGTKLATAGREGAIHAAGIAGAAVGATIGGIIAGPIGAWIGGAVVGCLGSAIAGALIPEPELEQRPVGGISLQGRPRVEILRGLQFSLDSLDEFYLDDNGRLVLLSATGRSTVVSGIGGAVTADDFLIALAIVFSDLEVSFSLDPWDCSNPNGPDLQKVFYPDMLRGTKFGDTLFETDYNLKKLAWGLCSRPTPGLRTQIDIALSHPSDQRTRYHRLWLVSEDVPLIVTGSESNGRQSIRFGECKMKCCCRRMCLDPTSRTGLNDDDRDDGLSSAHEFARELTRHYDAVARRCQEFERLRTLAKLIQLAKWIRQQPNTGIDRRAIMEALEARGLPTTGFQNTGPVSRSPNNGRVPRLTASGSRVEGNISHTVTFTGGIDLATKLVVQQQHELQAVKKRFISAADGAPNDKCQRFPGGVVFPLSVFASEREANEAAEQGEAFITDDPVIARDIALNALEISQQSRRAHMLLGRAYSELGLGREAIREFVKARLLSRVREEMEEARGLAVSEAAILARHVPRLVEVCRWAELFPICVPSDWLELEFKDVEPSVFRIFASKPSRSDTDHAVEVLTVAEISDAPDFTEIIARVRARETDMNLLMALYQSMIPYVFEGLEDAKLERIPIEQTDIATLIRAHITGNVNKQRYVYEHMFVVPEEGLAPDRSALFLMVSSLDCHSAWINVWCDHIFQAVLSDV
jgi:hypothetical protein